MIPAITVQGEAIKGIKVKGGHIPLGRGQVDCKTSAPPLHIGVNTQLIPLYHCGEERVDTVVYIRI